MSTEQTPRLKPLTQTQLTAARLAVVVGSRAMYGLSFLSGFVSHQREVPKAKRHGDVSGRSRRKLYRRGRLFALAGV